MSEQSAAAQDPALQHTWFNLGSLCYNNTDQPEKALAQFQQLRQS